MPQAKARLDLRAAAAVVRYFEHSVAAHREDFQRQLGHSLGVEHRVLQQVHQHLLDQHGVHGDHNKVLRQLQLYRNVRTSITDAYPLAGLLIPDWSLGSYISQSQLASLLGVDDTATSLQSMNDFQLDLKKIKKVQPENAKEGYLYFRLETDDTAADSPVLTLGVEKSGLLRAASPAVHILLDIPAHGIHTELTGTVTPAAPTLTAPTSRMQDSDIASLVQLRQTIESVVQFVQGAASGTQSAS